MTIGRSSNCSVNLSRGKNVIIDAGTCIKYDLSIQSIEYIGGSISPGLHMCYQGAAYLHTGKLPLVEPGRVAF